MRHVADHERPRVTRSLTPPPQLLQLPSAQTLPFLPHRGEGVSELGREAAAVLLIKPDPRKKRASRCALPPPLSPHRQREWSLWHR